MEINQYFQNTKGRGVLATADENGRVDVAIYATPHVIDEQTIAFIMTDRLSHQNIQSNPHAAYLFMEHGEKYAGKRLYLTKIREEKDKKLLDSLRRRKYSNVKGNEFLVYFQVDKILPLIGKGEDS